MNITLNGERLDIAEGTSLESLIEGQGFELARVIAEVDEHVVSKSDYDDYILHEGADILVLSFVGGG
ncbi:MAG: sulfur carrier protein ThiS [Clostridiales Family XIII bacterium]|jgi:sulfur carrier protein|nr:sulfur carrier protein ThiS [Clostridiales Family XIII bacterium]